MRRPVYDVSRWRWQDDASCADRLDLPWLTDRHHVADDAADAMRAVCTDCPVVTNCLAAVAAMRITGGWWAGEDRGHDTLTDPTTHTSPDDELAVGWEPVRIAGRPVAGVEQGVLDVGGAA